MAVALVAISTITACGGSDDATPDDASPDDAATDDASPDDAATDDASPDDAATGDAATDDAAPDDAEEDASSPDPGAEPGSDESSTSPGTGSLPADLCADGAPLNGAITLDDFVEFGILSTADATVEGSGAIDAVAYNDFGNLCNIEDTNGDFFTIGMSTGADTFEQSDPAVTQAGEWQYLVGDVIPQLVMLHTDADGNENTVFVNWFPADDSRASEAVAVITPLAEAIVDRSTVDVPMVDAPGTPPWFACDDSSPGVVGVDRAALMALVEVPEGVELETTSEIRASFGNTQCTTRTTAQNFPFVRFDVQESGAQLADTLDTYLAGFSDATAETIAGRDVAVRIDAGFGEAFVFTVIDGFPTTVQLSVTGFEGDLGEAARAITGQFFDAIG